MDKVLANQLSNYVTTGNPIDLSRFYIGKKLMKRTKPYANSSVLQDISKPGSKPEIPKPPEPVKVETPIQDQVSQETEERVRRLVSHIRYQDKFPSGFLDDIKSKGSEEEDTNLRLFNFMDIDDKRLLKYMTEFGALFGKDESERKATANLIATKVKGFYPKIDSFNKETGKPKDVIKFALANRKLNPDNSSELEPLCLDKLVRKLAEYIYKLSFVGYNFCRKNIIQISIDGSPDQKKYNYVKAMIADAYDFLEKLLEADESLMTYRSVALSGKPTWLIHKIKKIPDMGIEFIHRAKELDKVINSIYSKNFEDYLVGHQGIDQALQLSFKAYAENREQTIRDIDSYTYWTILKDELGDIIKQCGGTDALDPKTPKRNVREAIGALTDLLVLEAVFNPRERFSKEILETIIKSIKK